MEKESKELINGVLIAIIELVEKVAKLQDTLGSYAGDSTRERVIDALKKKEDIVSLAEILEKEIRLHTVDLIGGEKL